MSAQDNLSPQQFYHGSPAKIPIGGVILPSAETGVTPNFGLTNKRFAYAHPSDDAALEWGDRAARSQGRPANDVNLYTVEPLGDVEPDPNVKRDPIAKGSVRSRQGFRVTDVQFWGRKEF